MKRLSSDSSELKSADLVAENIERLRELFPEAFANEGKIDFDVLRQLLGDRVDDGEERYGLNWHGKRAARQLALTPSTGTLRPCPEESVDWDTTQNIFIEGDNLEVLKLLQKSYSGKVKLIYIDPPYNTGKDFVYPDNFQDSIKNYLEITGQVEGGHKIASNSEASGRFHTDWLNMMYSRLKLAKTLLCKEGIIFISIDDNEASQLQLVCDEVFGEENHAITMYVQVRYATKTLAEKNDYQKLIEQIQAYAGPDFVPIKATEEYTLDKFCWKINELGDGAPVRLGSRDALVFRDGEYAIAKVECSIEGLKETWATGTVVKSNASGKFFNDYIAPRKNEDGLGCLYKVFGIGEDGLGYRYFTGPKRDSATKGKFFSGVPLERREELSSGTATKEKPIPNLLDQADAFGNCRHEGGVDFGAGKKPLALLRQLLDISLDPAKPSIVVDFFAGSATTGHALWDKNIRDRTAHRFVLVQLPEACETAGVSTIADLAKKRLANASKALRADSGETDADLGFRVFKLDAGTVLPWDATKETLTEALTAAVDHVKPDRTEDDLLYDIILKHGLDLCAVIEEKQIASHKVCSVGSGTVFACLGSQIMAVDVEQLADGIANWRDQLAPADPKASRVIFRDSAFETDVAKTNLAAILKQRGFDEKLIVSL
jgi:adenine-specific DNA-methyltransferase